MADNTIYWNPRGPWLQTAVRKPDGMGLTGSARILPSPPVVDLRRNYNPQYRRHICGDTTNIPDVSTVPVGIIRRPRRTVMFPDLFAYTPGQRHHRIVALDHEYIWEATGYRPSRWRLTNEIDIACRWSWDSDWEPLEYGQQSALPSGLPLWPFIANTQHTFPHAVGLSIPRGLALDRCVAPATATNGVSPYLGIELGTRWIITDQSYEDALRALDDGSDHDYPYVRDLFDTLRRFGGLAIDTHVPETELGVFAPEGMFRNPEALAFQKAARNLEWQQAA